MSLEQRLLDAAEQCLLRPLDVQFALMVAHDEHPAVMLAAAMARVPASVAPECDDAGERARA